MFRRRHHLLRDVLIFSLPFVVFLFYVVGSALVSFYNAEIINFPGYRTRSLRVGAMHSMFRFAAKPVLNSVPHRYLADNLGIESDARLFDLRIHGLELESLDASMPGSAKEWVEAELREPGGIQEVEVRHRGQRMENFFWSRKSWKIKTEKYELVDGQRTINLTPLLGRLDNHLTFVVGRHLGLPTPQSRVVRLFLNMRDQGLYLQEEQVDESLIRRTGRMPGDVFYGEIFVPDEPKLSTDDLFCNPFLWEKKERNNKYDEEYRPHLTRMLDLVSDESPDSWDQLYELLDYDMFVRHFAVLTLQGDQHVDHSHNHKLYFSPVSGRFEPILWNVRLNMPRGFGIESMANRLYWKLSRDPRFLDDVHRVLESELLATDFSEELVAEVERLKTAFAQHALDSAEFDAYMANMTEIIRARRVTLLRASRAAEIRFTTAASAAGRVLTVQTRGLASQRLRTLEFDRAAAGLKLYEDRDFDGKVSAGDREIEFARNGKQISILGNDTLLYPGRDMSAPYRNEDEPEKESFKVHRQYTRLAFLESRFLLKAPSGVVPEVKQITVKPTVGDGQAHVAPGLLKQPGAVETLHPWRVPEPPAPVAYHFAKEAEVLEDLIVREQDQLTVTPGAVLRLGPGVSLITHSRVKLDNVKFTRLDEDKPWGVFALQGPGAAGSLLTNCEFQGGSHETVGFVDYLGMVSVHKADGVTLRGGTASDNVFGDDTIRFARCRDLLVEGVTLHGINGDAIDCDLSTGEIRDCAIQRPQNDGVDLMTSDVSLTRITVNGAGDKGISLGENANPILSDVEVVECKIGLAMKDGSDPLVSMSRIIRCEVGVAGYDKNWRYPGGGRGVLQNCKFIENEVDIKLDQNSGLQLEKCETSGNYSFPPDYEKSQFLELSTISRRLP